ncbi:MAG: hypothetical protein JNL10_11135 [Verrucomicrobiales bacterium]|nr:hypothetical protein [Verrucomicrobiales bacterium]
MRIHPVVSLGLLTLGLALSGCSRPDAPSDFQWRFAGTTALKAQTNAPVLAEALRVPQANAALGPLAARLAETWWQLGTGGKPLSSQDLAAGIALIPDLLSSESTGEFHTQATGGMEFVVAIHGVLNDGGAWEKQWAAWVQAMHAARGGGGAPGTARLDGWLVAVSDSSQTTPQKAWKALAARKAAPGALAEFEVKYPGQVALQAAMTCREGAARWTATARLAQPVTAIPAWELPGAIGEPIVFFTGIRSVPSLLQSLPWARSFAGKIVPKQVFAWGQPGLPDWGHTYFAALMDAPVAAVTELNRRFAPLFPPSESPRFRGLLHFDETIPRITISASVPVVPSFEAQKQGDRGYLTFGFLPAFRPTNSLAPEMLAQLNRTNLVYYDWEFTAAAAQHWHLLGQIEDLMEGRHAVTSTPATQWLLAVAPKAGETVTEGLLVDSKTIALRRKAPVGLSGLELAALARWIDPPPPMRRVLPSSTNAAGSKAVAPAARTNAPAAKKKP